MNPATNPNVTQAEDQIEKFIEKVIEDGKKRPLVANIAIGYEALASLASLFLALSVVPALFQFRTMSLEIDRFEPMASASFAGNLIAPMIFAVLALALQALAVHGLYHMRRYGIFAVAGESLLSLAALAMMGSVGLGFLVPGVLFYFLWKSRKKFA